MVEPFDWERIFVSDELPPAFIAEVVFRTVVMFTSLILILKLLSRRGVKQLSLFELAILIALGSATGDPMFYDHVPVAHGFAVIIVVIGIYKLITTVASRHAYFEKILEGKPLCILEDGVINMKTFRKIKLAQDKFFAELREKNIDHLGQVKKIYHETSGNLSVYYYEDENVKPGLPIFPELIEHPLKALAEEDDYACTTCGTVEKLVLKSKCRNCGNDSWLKAISRKRIT